MAAQGFIGNGDLYLNLFQGNTKLGLEGPFACDKFEIKPNVELLELVSKGRHTGGQVVESVARQQPADLTIAMTQVNRQSMGIALLANSSALAQASGSWLTGSPGTVVAKLDKWVSLGKRKVVEAGFVARHTTDTPVYVLGEDYEVNWDMGWIRFLSSGDVAADQTVEIVGAYEDYAGVQLQGSTNTNIRAEVILDGVNTVDSSPCKVTVHEATFAADAAFDFLANDFNIIELPGKMKTPVGKTEPYTVELETI